MKLRKRNMSERAQLEERCRKVCDEMEVELEEEQTKVKAADEKVVRLHIFQRISQSLPVPNKPLDFYSAL